MGADLYLRAAARGWVLGLMTAALSACGPSVTAPPVPAWRLEMEALSARYAVDRDLDLAGRRRLVALLALQANQAEQADLVAATLPEASAKVGIALRRLVRQPQRSASVVAQLPADGSPAALALGRWLAGEGLPTLDLAPEARAAEAAAAGDPTRLAEAFWLWLGTAPGEAARLALQWTEAWPESPDGWLAVGLTAPGLGDRLDALTRAAAGGVAVAHFLLAQHWSAQDRPGAAQAARFDGWRRAGGPPVRWHFSPVDWVVPQAVAPTAVPEGASKTAQATIEVLISNALNFQEFQLTFASRCDALWSPVGGAAPLGVLQARLGVGWSPARATALRCVAAGEPKGTRCTVELDRPVQHLAPELLPALVDLSLRSGAPANACAEALGAGGAESARIVWDAPVGWRPPPAWDSLALETEPLEGGRARWSVRSGRARGAAAVSGGE